MPIKIIIADDHRLFRQGIVNLLETKPEIEIIAQTNNGEETIEKVNELKPDVVIMDIGMPIINGIDATKVINEQHKNVSVIALSMHSDKHYVRGMLEAGAKGYLFKDCTIDELVDSINTVYAGKKYLSNKITEILINEYLDQEVKTVTSDPDLTEREFEILKQFAEGKSTKEIAESLFISVKTVGTHKQNMLNKLKLKSTTDLIKYALKKGIVTL